MPTRLLRDCTRSHKIASVSHEAELTFYRLIQRADDQGFLLADPAVLKAECYPLRSIREADLSVWVAQCATTGLIRLGISREGKLVLEIRQFRQRVRTPSKIGPLAVELSADEYLRLYEAHHDALDRIAAVRAMLSRAPPDSQVSDICPSSDGQLSDICPPKAQAQAQAQAEAEAEARSRAGARGADNCPTNDRHLAGNGKAAATTAATTAADSAWNDETRTLANQLARALGPEKPAAHRLVLTAALLVKQGHLPHELVQEALEATRRLQAGDRCRFFRGCLAAGLKDRSGGQGQDGYTLWQGLAQRVSPEVEELLSQVVRPAKGPRGKGDGPTG